MSSWRLMSRDPLVLLMILLSAPTGVVDAVSVLGLGKVFTANMTGNVVFLGFAAAGVPGFKWPLYVIGLACFAAGAMLAGRIGKAHAGGSRRRWLVRAALVEAALLWSSAVVAVDMVPVPMGAETVPWTAYAVIALSAAAMGSRNATARQLKVPDLTTTVLTLTITGMASDSRLGGGSNPNLARRVAAVMAILLGAMLGACLLMAWGLALPLLLAGACVLLGTLWLARDESPAVGVS
ncbi:YoaK family protein [Dyella sp.]|uniref:YoaK family protein n=1 Tax=Dyella sp. TaxID=1869338 RepID=UPI003F812B3C